MEEQVIKNSQDIKEKLLSIPKTIKIKKLSFKNFKVFDNYSLDFTNGKDIKDFICFIGPNGNGKSTILNAVVMLFNSLDNYEEDRIVNNLSRGIRNVENEKIDDFKIKAEAEGIVLHANCNSYYCDNDVSNLTSANLSRDDFLFLLLYNWMQNYGNSLKMKMI